MPQLRTVRVGMQRRFLSESVLHPVEQRPLVGLEFYVQLADKERHGLYLVALFLTGSRFKENS